MCNNPFYHDISGFKTFKPQEGFGGNPVDKESWWKMTSEMAVKAAQFNIFNTIEKQAQDNGLYNFSLGLVNGSDVRKLEKTKFFAQKAKLAIPNQKEIEFAEFLEKKGHTVYFTPENKTKNMKNYDAIIDGRVGEMKVLDSQKLLKIQDRLIECAAQKAQIACIRIPNETQYTNLQAVNLIHDFLNGLLKTSQDKDIPVEPGTVDTVYLDYHGILSIIKK